MSRGCESNSFSKPSKWECREECDRARLWSVSMWSACFEWWSICRGPLLPSGLFYNAMEYSNVSLTQKKLSLRSVCHLKVLLWGYNDTRQEHKCHYCYTCVLPYLIGSYLTCDLCMPQVLVMLYLLNILPFPCLTPSPLNPPCLLSASQRIIPQLFPCWPCQIRVCTWWAVCRQVINNYQRFFFSSASSPESFTFFSHLRNHGKRIFPLRTRHS